MLQWTWECRALFEVLISVPLDSSGIAESIMSYFWLFEELLHCFPCKLAVPIYIHTSSVEYVQFTKKLANCLPKWLYHFASPPLRNESSCWFTSLPAFGVVSPLNAGHSERHVVVSACFFNLQFPNGIWCGASFHMLVWHLGIFLGKVSIPIFCPFFIRC